MLFLVLAYLIIYIFLAWRRLDYAVMLIIFALPAYLVRFNVLGIPFTILEAMILSAFFVWLIRDMQFTIYLRGKGSIKRFIQNRKNRKPYPFGWEIILLLLVSFVAIGVAGFTDNAFGIWKAYFFEPLLFFILVLNLFSPSREKEKLNFQKIVFSLAASALAVPILAIYQKLTGDFIFNPLWQAESTRRVVSFFGYPNAVGLYLGPIVLILVGYLVDIVKKYKNQDVMIKKITNYELRITNIIIIISAIILSLLSIYFAKSEGALIGIAVAMAVFGLLAGKKIRYTTIVLLVFFGVTVWFSPALKNYVVNKTMLNDFSGQVRKLQWQETWKMLSDGRMIFGAGLANYQKVITPYHQEGFFYNDDNDPEFHRHVVWDVEYKKKHWQPLEVYMYPHNIILNFWSELGLFGMLLFAWIMAKYFILGIKNYKLRITNFGESKYKYLNIGLICAMIIIVVHGLVDAPYFKNDLAIMFWLWVAMMSIIKFEVINNKQENK